MNAYDKGDVVRLSAVFRDAAGALADPTTVLLKYKPARSNSAPTTLTYGVDVALVRDSLGTFHADVAVSQAGAWDYRWESTGTAQAAEAGRFLVRSNPLDPSDP